MTAHKQQSEPNPVASVIQIPGYRIKDILGRGGMATVYLAIQDSIGREVALKVLAPYHGDGTFSDRFLREARIVSRLTHPNIITVYDAGVHLGHHYMAMEYVPGKNLKQARDLLSRKQKVEVVKQVARALVCAGSKGYVHRDIKPENIMLHEDGRAILTDFGLARGDEVSSGLTVSGRAMGTPYYMSPEQTKGTAVDNRSDLYSLGVVLFQALSGHVPYDGPSMVAVGIKHISEPIPVLPDGLDGFQHVINTCMAKDPAHRFQTAQEFLQALETVSDSELDYFDAKEVALRKADVDPKADTLVGQPVSTAHLKSTSGASARMYASEPVAPLDITDSKDFRYLKKRRRRLLLVPALVGMLVAGYFYQTELNTYWQTDVRPWLIALLQSQQDDKLPSPQEAATITPSVEDDAERPEAKATATESPALEPVALDTGKQISPELAATIARLRNRADQLWTSLDQQPENSTKLAKLYQSWLKQHPGDSEARQRIILLRTWLEKKIPPTLLNGSFVQARMLFSALSEITPAVERNQNYTDIEARIHRAEQLHYHLQRARDFSMSNALVTPKGANALEDLRAALTIDPGNTEAQQAVSDIALTFYKRALQQHKASQLSEALETTTHGLTADPGHTDLITLKKDITQALRSQERIVAQLLRADEFFKSGKIVQPAARNAYSVYQEVLRLDPNNPLAKRGLRRIEQFYAGQALRALQNKQFIQAESILDTVEPYFKDSAILGDIRKRVNKASASGNSR